MKIIEGMNRFQKEHNVSELERAISHEVLNMIANQALPKMVWLVKKANPALKEERIAETQKVLLAASMNGLVTSLSLTLMDLSVGANFKFMHFVRQYVGRDIDNKKAREELWGTEYELPVRLAAGIIRDIRDGINLENPTKADFEKSETFAVARVFIDQQSCDRDVFAARNRQNKEIDQFISNYK